MLWTVAATLFFLAVHIAVAGRPGMPYRAGLTVSRGIAAVVLTAAGVWAVVAAWELWPLAFISHEPPGAPAYLLIHLALGHLLADFLWLGYGAWRHGERPRPDLVIHHALGLLVCAVVFAWRMAPFAVGLALTAEVMPVTSGVGGWARHTANARLAGFAQRLRLVVLLGWRLPLWTAIGLVVLHLVASGEAPSLRRIHYLALVLVPAIIALDVYWSVRSWQALRRGRAAPIPLSGEA